MTTQNWPETAERALWERIDTQEWDDLPDLLDPDLRVEYVHTGELFGRDAFVGVNRDYPGRWRGYVDAVVASGERVVARVRVSDGAATFHVASFGTVRHGRIVELVEVWADEAAPPAERRAAGGDLTRPHRGATESHG
ncbi:MAG: nuclear transport factor 2 family protein [Actinomycetota bacterium]|nr:nuclear transport factor 2 family protein [Actinomycetota bacterium]